MRIQKKGFSLIELSLVIAIALIMIAIALPALMKSEMDANERAARDSIIMIAKSQDSFLKDHSSYASTLVALGPKQGDLIDRQLASGQKHGYQFEMTAYVGKKSPAYVLIAGPVQPNVTGRLYLCMSSEDQKIFAAKKPIRATDAGCPLGLTALVVQ